MHVAIYYTHYYIHLSAVRTKLSSSEALLSVVTTHSKLKLIQLLTEVEVLVLHILVLINHSGGATFFLFSSK